MSSADPRITVRRSDPAERQEGGWGLRIAISPEDGQRDRLITLTNKLTIGRTGGEAVDLSFDDPQLSRRHAVVSVAPASSGCFVDDQGSTNGTFVDGKRADSERLFDGGVLRMGDTVALIEDGAMARPPVAEDPEILGRSAAMQVVVTAVRKTAATTLSVLVTGETGTGKEVIAQRLHALSGRRGSLVSVNAGAIPAQLVEAALFGHKKGAFTGATADAEGYFAAADGGTLFLDEIGELPLDLQPKLLRALDTGKVTAVGSTVERSIETRVVAATNVDLAAAVESGRFRRDLYARLSEYIIALPPLRQRRGDILLLLETFLSRFAPGRRFTMTADFVEALLVHDWPMNVRELRSLAKRLALVETATDVLELSALPAQMHPSREPESVKDAPPREELEEIMNKNKGNLLRVARHYGKARSQVYRWLSKYGIAADDFRK